MRKGGTAAALLAVKLPSPPSASLPGEAGTATAAAAMALPHHVVLNKKLRELECRITEIFPSTAPPPTADAMAVAMAEAEAEADTTPNTTVPIPEDVGRRLGFLKNLLLAEMESHPDDKPEYLHDIADRLAFLEDACAKWAKQDKSPFEESLETTSVCSCRLACFNLADDEEWTEQPSYAEAELPTVEAEAAVPLEPVPTETVEVNTRTGSEKRLALGFKASTLGATAVVVLLAAAVGLVVTDLGQDEQVFLVPT